MIVYTIKHDKTHEVVILGLFQFHNEEYASACAKFMCAGFGLSLFCDRVIDIILAKISK